MITAAFYVNAFVLTNGVYKVIYPLAIAKGTVLDYNFHFWVKFREFLQTHEGTRNYMTPRSTDAIALGPNSNLQGGIRCFSIVTGKIIQRQWQDAKVHKILVSTIIRENFICN